MAQWAMEGAPVRNREPGRHYGSAPFYDTREDVERAANFINGQRPDLPPVRILVRDSDEPGTPWNLAPCVDICDQCLGCDLSRPGAA